MPTTSRWSGLPSLVLSVWSCASYWCVCLWSWSALSGLGSRAWRRRGWITQERRLLQVVGSHLFKGPADMARLVPGHVAEPFTTADLARAAGFGRRLAQKMAYCLRKMGALQVCGKAGRALLYVRSTT